MYIRLYTYAPAHIFVSVRHIYTVFALNSNDAIAFNNIRRGNVSRSGDCVSMMVGHEHVTLVYVVGAGV